MKCWGWNDNGQLGDGSSLNDRLTPVTVSGITNAVAVSAGGIHSCALLTDGTVKCWGNNGSGELGDGSSLNDRLTPVTVFGITNAVAVSAGGTHSCALLTDGTVKCWGYNSFGQLGDGTTTQKLTPVTVFGITNAVAVSAGGTHSCALLTDGTMKCWGSALSGDLENVIIVRNSIPVTVPGITNAIAVSAGSNHSCALLTDGTGKSWGQNDEFGVLGDGTSTMRLTPVTVSGITNAVAVSAGGTHSCALLTDGTVKCWGNNRFRQLGDGTTTNRSTPVTVSGITNAIAIGVGRAHSCALLLDRSVKCWGYNWDGQLGDGTKAERHTPVSVIGL